MLELRLARDAGGRRTTVRKPWMKWTCALLALTCVPMGAILAARPKAGPPAIVVVAGTGLRDTQGCVPWPNPCTNGDGGQATLANLNFPGGVAVDAFGNLFIGEHTRIRRVTPQGIISTVAGSTEQGFSGDGGLATAALFSVITDLEFDAAGNLIVADRGNQRIRKITPDGMVSTIAGSGDTGSSGDGGPAISARFNMPTGIAIGPAGTIYVADWYNHRIRKIDANGIITNAAGSGYSGFSPDGTLASSAMFDFPEDVAIDKQGRIVIADTRNSGVRRVEADGRLSTIAGGGSFDFDPVATNVALPSPRKLAIDSGGNVLVINSQRVMRVSLQGRLEILAGLTGCDGSTCHAVLDTTFTGLQGVTTAAGAIYVADEYNYYVHKISGYPAPAPLIGINAFAPPSQTATGSIASAVVVGDINADGRDDAVVATTKDANSDAVADHHLFIFLQQADGTLAAPVKRPYLRTAMVVGLALGDMNNDGVRDIVVGHDQGLTLFAGGSASAFNGTVYPSATAANDLLLTDANGDGNLDVVSMQDGSTRAVFHYGNGRLGISSSIAGPVGPGTAAGIVPGDFNDDGWTDFAAASENPAGGFNVFTRSVGGTFTAGPLLSVAAGPEYGPKGMFAGDLNADGRHDLGYLANTGSDVFWLHPQRAGTGLDPVPRTLATHKMGRSGRVTDINRDGRKDLVVLHNQGYGQEALGLYLATPAGLPEEIFYPVPNSTDGHVGHKPMDVGDLDSDGCPDIAIANNLSGLVVVRGRNCRQRSGAKADLAGDETAEIIWRNTTTGQNLYWRAGRSGGTGILTTVTDPQWKARLSGDFDGDGRADIFWRHSLSGASVIWKAGNYQNQQPVMAVTGTAWQVAGAGDFNGDGKDDLLWHNVQTGANVIWKSASYSSQQAVTGVTDLNWGIAGVDDFNGDGKADILWRHATQGRNTIWLSGNSAAQQTVATTDASWRIAGVGDLNDDGRADLLWRNSVSGVNHVWRGASSADVLDVTDVTDLNWRVAAVADYDGDGRDDILWRNVVTGVNAIWKSGYYGNQQPVSTHPASWAAVN